MEYVPAVAPIDYAQRAKPWRAAIVQALNALDAETGQAGTILVSAAAQLIRRAVGGDAQALRELADRMDGKPAQDVALPPGSELGVSFVIRGPAPMSREDWTATYGAQKDTRPPIEPD